MKISAVESGLMSTGLAAPVKMFRLAIALGFTQISPSLGCEGEALGTGPGAKNFFIDSAGDPELTLFDGTIPKAVRICTRMNGFVRVSYTFSDRKTGQFLAPPETCADIYAARVAVRPDCASHEHGCEKSSYACNDGTRHEALSYVITKYSETPAEDSDLSKRTTAGRVPDEMPEGGVTLFVSEKPMDVDLWYGVNAKISLKEKYPASGEAVTQETKNLETRLSGASVSIAGRTEKSGELYSYRIFYK